ncbi:hypothetical protein ACS0TY_014828 [Phlomoides rotata]
MWKKEYGTLSDLLSKSGIGWNSSTNTLDIIDEAVWDAHKRVDTHVKTMGNKSWPYYDRWVDIFGKDHATGEHAIDLIDIVNDMFTNTCEQEGGNGKIGDENSPAKNVVDENTSIAQPSESGIKSSSNKGSLMILDMNGKLQGRVTGDNVNPLGELDEMEDVLGELHISTTKYGQFKRALAFIR